MANSGSSDVYKWIASILATMLVTIGGMMLRQDYLMRDVASASQVQELKTSVDKLSQALSTHARLLKQFGITEEEAARRLAEFERLRGGPNQ